MPVPSTPPPTAPDPLPLAGPPRKAPRRRFAHPTSWLMLAALWLVYAMNANVTAIIFATSALIADEFTLSPGRLGLIIGLFTCARGLLAPVLATWVDRGGQGWARKYRQLTVAAVYLGSCFLVGFDWVSATLAGFFAISLVRYLAAGVGEAIEVTAVSEWWPRHRRGFAQGAHHTAFPWGTFLGSQVIALVLTLTNDDWRVAYLVFPLVGLPFLAFYWFASTPERFARVVEFARRQDGEMALGEDAADVKARPGALGRALRNPNVHCGAIASGVQQAVYLGVSTWIPLYLVHIGEYTAAAAASAGFLFTLTGGAGQIVWGAVSDRFGRKSTMVFCCGWLAIAVELLRLTTSSSFSLVFFQLVFGVCSNAVYPILYAWGSDSSETGAVGISNSLQVFYQGLGGLMPFAIGLMIAAAGGFHAIDGYLWSLHVMAAAQVVCLLLVLLLMRETTGRSRGRDVGLVSLAACNIPDA